ncbi:hypothetical protein P152DRAFT_74180 [Eremomyces bilateralis CBS 781.70]|uniref:Uncharacterized protein n=1 Tax=Eremomyces bilateralis CBS 781.70 TaxID=1392243 RepID=A0A6G1FZ79_9PEZI|nr:uncharacterized protein P152DRAFT_74180 [Eremomyces bilateralis CBS 781.70]KAF1811022.1 hypothetical protein P152DRAFT_74180 [Eremomyces bilateralis CBS 781.70]
MQFKATLLTTALLATSVVAVAEPAPQVTGFNVDPASTSAFQSELSSWMESLTDDPAFTSFGKVIATGVPSSVLNNLLADPSAAVGQFMGDTAPPAWYTALPSSAQSYIQSMGDAQMSIFNKYSGGASTTSSGGSSSGSGSASSSGNDKNDAASQAIGFAKVAAATLAVMGFGIAML